MSHDSDYCVEQLKPLVGGELFMVVTAPPDSFGFQVIKDGKLTTVWIDRDAEGNGPGWVNLEAAEEVKSGE